MSKLKAKMQSDINQEATTMLKSQELSYEIELKQKEIAMQKRTIQTIKASMQRILSENEESN